MRTVRQTTKEVAPSPYRHLPPSPPPFWTTSHIGEPPNRQSSISILSCSQPSTGTAATRATNPTLYSLWRCSFHRGCQTQLGTLTSPGRRDHFKLRMPVKSKTLMSVSATIEAEKGKNGNCDWRKIIGRRKRWRRAHVRPRPTSVPILRDAKHLERQS